MEKLRIRVASTILAMLFVSTSVPGLAASPAIVRTLTPENSLRFTPPVSDQVIQTFDYGSGIDVFFAQQVGNSTRLSRCTRTSAGTCTQRDSVMLPGYGHGESLEVYTKNGRTFAWVGSDAGATPPFYPSRAVSLVEYIKAPAGSKKAGYRRIGTLTDLAAIAPGRSGPAVHSAIAISDTSNRLAIRVQLGGLRSTAYYGMYKTAALTARMMKAPGQKLSISKASDLLVSHFIEPAIPNNSFQSFDINGGGTSPKNLYVFGGYAGQSPTVYRYTWTNSGKISHVRSYILEGNSISGVEAEGLKVESDPTSGGRTRVQIGLVPTERDNAGRRIFRLFRFAE